MRQPSNFKLDTSIETPSGKDVAYENFPVGSWLLPPALRPHISVFYRFARAIDDIADDPGLPATEKVARLEGFEAALLGDNTDDSDFATGHRMRESLLVTNITLRHGLDLIDAFKQDAINPRYANWDELMSYCNRSAAPVGRYLLDLHGGSRDGYGPSDALCNALQVINHLQDCQDDYRQLDRVYLPLDWMREVGTDVAALNAPKSIPGLRFVIDRCLDATEPLMAEARNLSAGLVSRRLAMESAAIIRIAETLIEMLRRGDPLGKRIQLSKPGYLWQCICGAVPVAFGFRGL